MQSTELAACEKSSTHAAHPVIGQLVAWTDGEPCAAYFATYQLPETWDGNGWNETAVPQELFSSSQIVLTQTHETFVPDLPECGAVQIDILTFAPPQSFGWPGIPGGVVHGHQFYTEVQVCPPDVQPTKTHTDKPKPIDTGTNQPGDHKTATVKATRLSQPAALPQTGSGTPVGGALLASLLLMGIGALLLLGPGRLARERHVRRH